MNLQLYLRAGETTSANMLVRRSIDPEPHALVLISTLGRIEIPVSPTIVHQLTAWQDQLRNLEEEKVENTPAPSLFSKMPFSPWTGILHPFPSASFIQPPIQHSREAKSHVASPTALIIRPSPVDQFTKSWASLATPVPMPAPIISPNGISLVSDVKMRVELDSKISEKKHTTESSKEHAPPPARHLLPALSKRRSDDLRIGTIMPRSMTRKDVAELMKRNLGSLRAPQSSSSYPESEIEEASCHACFDQLECKSEECIFFHGRFDPKQEAALVRLRESQDVPECAGLDVCFYAFAGCCPRSATFNCPYRHFESIRPLSSLQHSLALSFLQKNLRYFYTLYPLPTLVKQP